ncbi:MAG: prepilin-type N-terminal cleavage/methylation domain-containing protein [Firmicutes bacterium]|nr:prepilin-type N-terminal cleavage/methylation domain-containing protein [Bacillota bacterium]
MGGGGGLVERKVGERGFTLIEILVAVAILAVAVIPIMDVITGGLAQVYRGRDIVRASFLVRQAAEEAKAADFPALGPREVPDYAGSGLELRQEVTPVPGMDPGKVKKVTVGIYRDGRLLADAVFLVYEKGY